MMWTFYRLIDLSCHRIEDLNTDSTHYLQTRRECETTNMSLCQKQRWYDTQNIAWKSNLYGRNCAPVLYKRLSCN
jgi:hypothetical protein